MKRNKNKNGGSNTDSIMVQEEAEVDHFFWDDSNNDKVELMKGVEKEEGKEKWNQEETAGKRKTVTGKTVTNNATPTKQSRTIVTVQTNDASATKTVAESMKKTPVEAQWVLKLGSTTSNVRAALLALLKRMAT
eukprot:7538924-Ditylum_brightwellii.AAC.1